MIKIRRITEKDVPAISKAHIEIFDKSHLTSNFPETLLQKYFYKLISQNDYNFIAVENEDDVKGYIISGFHTQEATLEFRKENWFQMLLVLLTHPRFLAEKIVYILKKKPEHSVSLRLLMIGVKPGLGLGRQMLSHYENEIIKDGCNEYGLSVRKDNIRATNFYINNGFVLECSTFNSFRYIKKIN